MILSSTEFVEDAVPSGESDALAAIFKSHSRRVIGLCRHMLGDRALAEDAGAEVFLKLRTAIATYDSSSDFDRWLLRIAANHCIDLIRRRKLERRWMSEEDSAADAPSQEASPLTQLLLKERQDEVTRAVEGLADAYRLPLVLRYYADLSYDEIAAELDMEKTQVAGRIFRAKHMLRALLEEKVL